MPYEENVHAVRLVHGRERALGELEVPTCRPYFTLLRPGHDSFIDSTGVLHLHWADHDSQLPLTYFVRCSHNGKDWLRPGVNLRTTDYYLDLRQMPGGPHCVVQVLATNGYRTAFVQTRPFDVAVKPLEVMLGDANSPILFAQGYSRQDGPLTGNAIAWLDHSGTVVGRGGTFDVRTLPARNPLTERAGAVVAGCRSNRSRRSVRGRDRTSDWSRRSLEGAKRGNYFAGRLPTAPGFRAETQSAILHPRDGACRAWKGVRFRCECAAGFNVRIWPVG